MMVSAGALGPAPLRHISMVSELRLPSNVCSSSGSSPQASLIRKKIFSATFDTFGSFKSRLSVIVEKFSLETRVDKFTNAKSHFERPPACHSQIGLFLLRAC